MPRPKKPTMLDAAIAQYLPGQAVAIPQTPTATNSSGKKLSFDIAQYLPSDLLKDSSSLPPTDEASAQAQLSNIEGKRRTVQVIRANLGLATDLEKAQGDFIDYQIAGATNDIKTENLRMKQTELLGAQIQTEIAGVRNSALRLELAGSQAELQADVEGWRQKLQAKRNKLALGEEKIKALNAQAKAEFPDYQPPKVVFNPLTET